MGCISGDGTGIVARITTLGPVAGLRWQGERV